MHSYLSMIVLSSSAIIVAFGPRFRLSQYFSVEALRHNKPHF